MTEGFLALIILGLIGYIAYNDRLNRAERKMFLQTMKAKNAQELRDLEMASNTRIELAPPAEPDLIPESEASDAQWQKALQAEIDQEEADAQAA
jgi:hypothetical protein